MSSLGFHFSVPILIVVVYNIHNKRYLEIFLSGI